MAGPDGRGLRRSYLCGLAAAAAVLQGCASHIAVGGSERLPEVARASGVALKPELNVPAGPASDKAAAAVMEELSLRGVKTNPAAPYWVEVGFAVSPTRLEVAEPAHGGTAAAPLEVVLCKRQRYAMSLAIVDRADGSVLLRKRASAKRCGAAPNDVLPALARALVASL